uniref:N-acetylgalactosaminide beta-1,3-galactosyltransferase n=1 Tax=Ascaris suum TaxID=6253 RepID=F1KWS1_ASCSU
MLFDSAGVSLVDAPKFCLLRNESECITRFTEPNYENCSGGVTNEDVFFAVKTFSGYHKTRVVVVKRTWAKTVKYIEYFSDTTDHYVPTIDLGINNTQRGHCSKTLAILKHFLQHDEVTHSRWLVVVDDDTLLSAPRLYRLLSCYSPQKKLIIGERYGYGFSADGHSGYDYPTGGAGMIFSRSAVRLLVSSCHCPHIDSPDDMIIGWLCSRHLFNEVVGGDIDGPPTCSVCVRGNSRFRSCILGHSIKPVQSTTLLFICSGYYLFRSTSSTRSIPMKYTCRGCTMLMQYQPVAHYISSFNPSLLGI